MSMAKQRLKSSYVVSHAAFFDGLSVVSCANVGIEAGEIDGLGVRDGCGVFGLAVGCLGLLHVREKKCQRGAEEDFE